MSDNKSQSKSEKDENQKLANQSPSVQKKQRAIFDGGCGENATRLRKVNHLFGKLSTWSLTIHPRFLQPILKIGTLRMSMGI